MRLNDEKIICQPQLELHKDEMPGLAPGIFICRMRFQERSNLQA